MSRILINKYGARGGCLSEFVGEDHRTRFHPRSQGKLGDGRFERMQRLEQDTVRIKHLSNRFG